MRHACRHEPRAARSRRSPDGAAVLVDPLDPAAIAAGIEEAAARRDELRALGLERARRFTWDAAAEATAGVYREAAA